MLRRLARLLPAGFLVAAARCEGTLSVMHLPLLALEAACLPRSMRHAESLDCHHRVLACDACSEKTPVSGPRPFQPNHALPAISSCVSVSQNPFRTAYDDVFPQKQL